MMKKLFYISIFFVVFASSCEYETCIECDIYDDYGHFVKEFGEYCGSDSGDLNYYEDEANFHAEEFYGGWAECSRY